MPQTAMIEATMVAILKPLLWLFCTAGAVVGVFGSILSYPYLYLWFDYSIVLNTVLLVFNQWLLTFPMVFDTINGKEKYVYCNN